jgi:hypothetical protein
MTLFPALNQLILKTFFGERPADEDVNSMTLEQIKNLLGCQVLTPEFDLSSEVSTVLASDGMSEILAFHSPGALMVTGLTNIQSVRTADVADVRAIVYIRGKWIGGKTIELARQ